MRLRACFLVAVLGVGCALIHRQDCAEYCFDVRNASVPVMYNQAPAGEKTLLYADGEFTGSQTVTRSEDDQHVYITTEGYHTRTTVTLGAQIVRQIPAATRAVYITELGFSGAQAMMGNVGAYRVHLWATGAAFRSYSEAPASQPATPLARE